MTNQPFPDITLALTEPRQGQPGKGFITQPWLYLIRVLWQRSGGVFGVTQAGQVGFLGLDWGDAAAGDEGMIIPGPPGMAGPQGLLGPPGADGADGEDGFPVALVAPPPRGATFQSGALSPAGPNSTSAVTMQGMAGSVTPKTTGNILVNVTGTLIASAALVDQGMSAQIYYGAGSAPGSNAAVTGTPTGGLVQWTNLVPGSSASDINVPFSLTGIITAARLGVPLWLDVGAEAITTASVFSISNAVIVAAEV